MYLQIKLSPLTIICGRNNVGKTYISHALYACLKETRNQISVFSNPSIIINAFKKDQEINTLIGVITTDIREIIRTKDDISAKVSASLSKSGLSSFFNTNSTMGETELQFEFEVDVLGELYKKQISIQRDTNEGKFLSTKPAESFEISTAFQLKEPQSPTNPGPNIIAVTSIETSIQEVVNIDAHIATSERTGIALFQPIVDEITNKLARETADLKKARASTRHIVDSFSKVHSLPRPILDNMEFTKSREGGVSNLPSEHMGLMSNLIQTLAGGDFLEQTSSVNFRPTNSNVTIPFSMASSSTKSIYLIEKFIKKRATKGSTFIIDEPELNLHIDNQLRMADLLALLVNAGVNIVITTHSDHMLREFNNLIMLGSKKIAEEDVNDLQDEYDITSEEILDPSKVSAYVVSASGKKIHPVSITPYGLDFEIFDKEIICNNKKLRSIQSAIQN